MMQPQIGDKVRFVLSDGSGYEHLGTVVDLFEDPADGLYVTTEHVANLSVLVDEITWVGV